MAGGGGVWRRVWGAFVQIDCWMKHPQGWQPPPQRDKSRFSMPPHGPHFLSTLLPSLLPELKSAESGFSAVRLAEASGPAF